MDEADFSRLVPLPFFRFALDARFLLLVVAVFLVCFGNGCVISVPLWDHFMVGISCMSIGDLCCAVAFDARPFDRDLDRENPVFFVLLGVLLDILELLHSDVKFCVVFS